jgi:hypothetical protein
MITLITTTIGLLVAVFIAVLVRQDRLHTNHAMSWLLVAAGFALLGFAPSVVDKVAASLCIGYPPVLALSLAIVALVIKILMMDVESSRLQIRYQRLIQRVAML